MASTVPRSELKFTKMCRHWIAGKCNMGQSCNFAHSDLELREQPNLVATQLCFRFSAKGRCNKGAKCTFAHGREELRRTEKRRDSRRANLEPMRVKLQDDCRDQVAVTSVTLASAPMSVQDLSCGLLSVISPPPGLEPPTRQPLSIDALLRKDCSETVSLASTRSPRDEM
ncbi:unnamed protein product [Cladocopium goreaui]|uniref:C3H1-type domain-containing protein n=1 Tax=Cladocopium goreaui TaxID=2562237 RepID=A0A9P1DQR7_9DINO|nr:unnamed protein product [Cladocopium goreaui]|mmetsp:Transcript_3599/g.8373  ORF Transcript_3599/g.8373 Transcript_3599/m.8373 type:complete len:170 (-) Transcript_3599:239-748(-)